MSTSVKTRVLIAGAGPTGLTLGCELARRGIPFRIAEASRTPFVGSRGKGLQPRTLEVLDNLGLIDAVLAAGTPYPRFRVHLGPLSFPAGGLNKVRGPTAQVPYPNLWLLPQWRTGELLRARLEAFAGGPVELGTRLAGFTQDPDGVTAQLETERGTEEVHAEYLVGCDGGHSTVRKSLGLGFAGEVVEERQVVVADVETDSLDHASWHAFPLARGALIAMCPLPEAGMFQLAAPLSKKTAAPELTVEGLRAFVRGALGSRAFEIKSAPWISAFRPQMRMVEKFCLGRVFLAGDAAHVHSPAGGQGLNTGIQDAYNLGWKLAEVLRGAPQPLLDTYQEERLPVAAEVLGLSMRLHLTRSTRRGDDTQQLRLHYRGGPLSTELRASPGDLRAGDRAPDARCRDASGSARRLFDVLRGPHATLLCAGAGADRVVTTVSSRWSPTVHAVRVVPADVHPAEHDLVDPDGELTRRYALELGGSVLIRPDGYLGFCAPLDQAPALDGYLGRTFAVPKWNEASPGTGAQPLHVTSR